MRTLTDLKNKLKSADFFESTPLIHIVDNTGTALAPSFFCQVVRAYGIACRVRDASNSEAELLSAQLASTLLDERICYIMYSSAERLKKKNVEPFNEYAGPHTIFSLIAQAPKSLTAQVLTLSSTVDVTIFLALHNLLFDQELSGPTPFMRQIFSRYKQISFAAAYALLSYQHCVSATDTLFFKEWVEEIISPERSLFALSSAFFSKNCAETLRLWRAVKDDYAPHFWTIYWSEQLFRAAVYCALKEQQSSQTQSAAYRLPFSFIQRDWRMATMPELTRAHNLLYTFDQRLKLGASAPFELMISTYCAK